MSDKSAWTAYAQPDDGNADALGALQEAEGAPYAAGDLAPDPPLYAELDRLRAEVERLEAEHMGLRQEVERQWERAGRAARRVVTKTRKVRAENADLRTENARLRDLLEDLTRHCAVPVTHHGRPGLSTAGESDLEEAFALLGWDDPYCEESRDAE